MTSFRYEAINPDGTLLKGQVEARDIRGATRELKRRGLTPVVLDEAKARALKNRARTLGPRERMLAIGELAMLVEAEDKMRQEMRNALTYPLVLICAGVGAVLFIFTAVVPRFSAMFAGRMNELPALSRWVLGLGVMVNDNLAASLLATAGALALLVLALRRPET